MCIKRNNQIGMAEQLPLLFEYRNNQNFACFFPGNNQEVVDHLQAFIADNTELQLFLWGNAGLGKTHLLQACCQLALEMHKSAFYLRFDADRLPDPAILDGMEQLDVICLDNIEHVAGQAHWEKRLFDFYNRHRDLYHQLLISSAISPAKLDFHLPDLNTRMNWGLSLKLQPLNDDQLINALKYKAQGMGFEISEQVGGFLMTRYARDLPALWRLLEKIDQATLAAQRKPTIPFLKQIMASHGE